MADSQFSRTLIFMLIGAAISASSVGVAQAAPEAQPMVAAETTSLPTVVEPQPLNTDAIVDAVASGDDTVSATIETADEEVDAARAVRAPVGLLPRQTPHPRPAPGPERPALRQHCT